MVVPVNVPNVQLASPVRVSENAAINFFNALPKQKINALDAISQGLDTFIEAEQKEVLVNIKQQELEETRKKNQLEALVKRQNLIKGDLEIQQKEREVVREAQSDTVKLTIGDMISKGNPNVVDMFLSQGHYLSTDQYKQTLETLRIAYPNNTRLWEPADRIRREKVYMDGVKSKNDNSKIVQDQLSAYGISIEDIVNVEPGVIPKSDGTTIPEAKVTTIDGRVVKIPINSKQGEVWGGLMKDFSNMTKVKKENSFVQENNKDYARLAELENQVSNFSKVGSSNNNGEVIKVQTEKDLLVSQLNQKRVEQGLPSYNFGMSKNSDMFIKVAERTMGELGLSNREMASVVSSAQTGARPIIGGKQFKSMNEYKESSSTALASDPEKLSQAYLNYLKSAVQSDRRRTQESTPRTAPSDVALKVDRYSWMEAKIIRDRLRQGQSLIAPDGTKIESYKSFIKRIKGSNSQTGIPTLQTYEKAFIDPFLDKLKKDFSGKELILKKG